MGSTRSFITMGGCKSKNTKQVHENNHIELEEKVVKEKLPEDKTLTDNGVRPIVVPKSTSTVELTEFHEPMVQGYVSNEGALVAREHRQRQGYVRAEPTRLAEGGAGRERCESCSESMNSL